MKLSILTKLMVELEPCMLLPETLTIFNLHVSLLRHGINSTCIVARVIEAVIDMSLTANYIYQQILLHKW